MCCLHPTTTYNTNISLSLTQTAILFKEKLASYTIFKKWYNNSCRIYFTRTMNLNILHLLPVILLCATILACMVPKRDTPTSAVCSQRYKAAAVQRHHSAARGGGGSSRCVPLGQHNNACHMSQSLAYYIERIEETINTRETNGNYYSY